MTSITVLVVVRDASNTNYDTAPRYFVEIQCDKSPHRRSSNGELKAIYKEAKELLANFIPSSSSRLLIWLVDSETKQPVLFLTGLANVQKGKLSIAEAQAWEECLLPQITSPQTMRCIDVDVSASVSLTLRIDEDFVGREWGFGLHDVSARLPAGKAKFASRWQMQSERREKNTLKVDTVMHRRMTIDVPWEPDCTESHARWSHIHGSAFSKLEYVLFDADPWRFAAQSTLV